MKKYSNKILNILIFFTLYILINLITIKYFPFVHSDETWLSGLSRNMIENRSLAATEPFFDLLPRTPHAIKSLFHSVQMLFIGIFGYSVWTVRMVSVFFSGISIVLFYSILDETNLKKTNKLLLTAALIFNVQFIYSSRFARQEAIMLVMFLLVFKVLISQINNKHMLLSVLLVTAIGIHPNSFILAVSAGFCFLYLIYTRREKLLSLVKLVAITGLGASFYVGISYYWNMNFISNYSEYGSTLGVDSSVLDKVLGIFLFYKKLYLQIGATYYLPDIRFFLSVGLLIIMISIISLLSKQNYDDSSSERTINILSLLMLVGVNVGIIIIGRYNQTSIIFIFPFILILLGTFLTNKNEKVITFILVLFLGTTMLSSYKNITSENYEMYDSYLNNISRYVKPTDIVLANLNAEPYFDNGNLLDYRNLSYLGDNDLSFSEYIETNHIEYIIYPEEMDYIYRNIDKWWIMYGKMPYYDDMQDFINNHTTLIGSFDSPSYGMRIVPFMNDYPWKVSVFKVN